MLLTLTGCNYHPIKASEFKHYTDVMEDDGAGDSSSSDEGGSETGAGTSDTGYDDGGGTGDGGSEGGAEDGGDDGSIKFDVGPVCGNGILEPGEDCDNGEDNGPFEPCSDECFWNAQ